MTFDDYTYETLVYIFAGAVVVCLLLISIMFAYILNLRKKSTSDVEASGEKNIRTTSETSIKTLIFQIKNSTASKEIKSLIGMIIIQNLECLSDQCRRLQSGLVIL